MRGWKKSDDNSALRAAAYSIEALKIWPRARCARAARQNCSLFSPAIAVGPNTSARTRHSPRSFSSQTLVVRCDKPVNSSVMSTTALFGVPPRAANAARPKIARRSQALLRAGEEAQKICLGDNRRRNRLHRGVSALQLLERHAVHRRGFASSPNTLARASRRAREQRYKLAGRSVDRLALARVDLLIDLAKPR